MNPVRNQANPMLLMAAEIHNADLNQLDQNDINDRLALMIVGQDEQRQKDLDVLQAERDGIKARVKIINDDVAEVRGKQAVLGAKLDNLVPRMQVVENRINQIPAPVPAIPKEIQVAIPAAAKAVLADETLKKRLVDAEVELKQLKEALESDKKNVEQRKKLIDEAVIKIRESLTQQINDQGNKEEIARVFAIALSIFTSVICTGFIGGVIGLSEYLKYADEKGLALFKAMLSTNLIPVPVWMKDLFHAVKEENLKNVLNKFERYLLEGLNPEIALELARK